MRFRIHLRLAVPVLVFAAVLLVLGVVVRTTGGAQGAPVRPNVLFIAVDDLNDWVGVLGGHPQAKTPNIDRLASRGTLFANAHCAAPLCNPSRTALLTGRRPTTTGVYGNRDDWRQFASLRDAVTLPLYFRQQGYWTASGGKIFHANHGGFTGALTTAEGAPYGGRSGNNQPAAWDEGFPSKTVQLPLAPVLLGTHRNGINHHWDWGPLDHPIEETEDGQTSRWAVSQLRKKHTKPFFLAVGIYKPHDPQYAPDEFFDQHPLDKVELPSIKADDLADVPVAGKRYALRKNNWNDMIVKHNALPAAVRAYLAAVTFADAMVGRVLDALDASPYADNTIICLWSDHGYHLGEKEKYHKSTLWEESTRVPLIIVVPPGIASGLASGAGKAGSVTQRPVSLVDIYPTLVELAGLPVMDGLDGASLAPLLKDPGAPRDHPALTSRSAGDHAVRDERWRYIRYGDGSEELYDHDSDPMEWENLAGSEEYRAVKERLAEWIPKNVARAER